MARTKAEIRAFLDGQVGKIAPHPGYPSLNGQCVTLTKALMEFLGVPNPYAARGDAINAGDTYIRQGLGTAGKGWLTIVVNRDMGYIGGVHYGHIWIDVQGEANYEANGARALYTTKNTRPISQGQQFVNFDKWVKEDNPMSVTDLGIARILSFGILGRNGSNGKGNALDGDYDADLNKNHVGQETNGKVWQFYQSAEGLQWKNETLPRLIKADEWAKALEKQLATATENLNKLNQQIADLSKRPTQAQLDELVKSAAEAKAQADAAKAELDKLAKEKAEDEKTGNAFLRWLGDQLNKILGKG